MPNNEEILRCIGDLERALKHHPDAEVKNLNRLRSIIYPHTGAVCKAILAIVEAFADRKVVVLVEVEIAELGCRARPEDIVAWIEGVGVFVIEVKSHTIAGIRSFENNVPQVIYRGQEEADVDLLDQPKDFAFKLMGILIKQFDSANKEPPPLFFAGWLPNVSPEDVARKAATVASDKVWLDDMLNRDEFLHRIHRMKNLTRGTKAERSTLEVFCRVFGTTSGLHRSQSPRPTQVGSVGHLIDRKNLQLKKLTKEQEDLAFSPNLTRGPKVIRGVAGSGKTVVLANAVAETFLRAMSEASVPRLFKDASETPDILVLCYNRALAPFLRTLISQCFEARKPDSTWVFPNSHLNVINIDRYAYQLARQAGVEYRPGEVGKTVTALFGAGLPDRGKNRHVFIDEGQDIELDWYPLIQQLTVCDEELGPSIVVFYDEAQNLYGVKMPGVGDTPPWREYLGAVPNSQGLRTVMRVGHRNTNEVLSFSFNLLLGSFAEENPQMVQFAGISKFEDDIIPIDPSIDHPNAGKPCVEKINDRQYRVNFAVSHGPPPNVHACLTEKVMLDELANEIERVLDPDRDNVDPSDVLVMAPETEHVRNIVTTLSKRNIPTHVPLNLDEEDRRDLGCFVRGKVAVGTIKSAKGYTAHVCHLAYVHRLDGDGQERERRQQNRAQVHVACTRSSLLLDLWGLIAHY